MLRLLVILAFLAGLAPPGWAEEVPNDRLDLDRFVSTEMDSLEQRYEICYPADFQPIVRVGIPEFIPEYLRVTLGGLYQPDSSIISISQSIVDPFDPSGPWPSPLTLLTRPSLTEIVDHELGHVYADRVSRMIRGQVWPNFDSTTCIANGVGMLIQSEGIGQTFGRGLPTFPFRAEWWEASLDSLNLEPGMPMLNTLGYDGGYRLVGTLAARHGVGPTVAYIVTHPLIVDSKHLRQSIVEWYDQADCDLGGQH